MWVSLHYDTLHLVSSTAVCTGPPFPLRCLAGGVVRRSSCELSVMKSGIPSASRHLFSHLSTGIHLSSALSPSLRPWEERQAVPQLCIASTGAVPSEETVLFLDPFAEAVFCHFEPAWCASVKVL